MIVAFWILLPVAVIVLCAVLVNGERYLAEEPLPRAATLTWRQRRNLRRNRADLRAALRRPL